MDAIAGISARLDAIAARARSLPVPTGSAGGSSPFARTLAGELNRVGTGGSQALGYSATGATPGAGDTRWPGPASVLGGSFAPIQLGQPWVAPTGLTPVELLAPGQYGPLEPPAELVGYGNGTIPTAALAPIGVGDHRLWAPAARAFVAMSEAARAEGIEIGVTDSYRTLAAQERLAREKGLYAEGGLAARPGTSNHGWGLSLDLRLDDAALAWMRRNGHRFGFVEDVPREPWHWTYRA